MITIRWLPPHLHEATKLALELMKIAAISPHGDILLDGLLKAIASRRGIPGRYAIEEHDGRRVAVFHQEDVA